MSLPFPNIKFDNTLGAVFIGFTVSAVLYGMFSIQVFSYYRRYYMDKGAYKAIVALLWLTETTHQALLAHALYFYTVTNYMNMASLLLKPVWSLVTQLVVGAFVGTVVKFLFSMRVWRFSYGNVWLTGILMLLTFGQLGIAITFAVKSFELAAMTDLVNLRVLGSISLGLGVVNDISVAASLCYYLQSMRKSYDKDSIITTLTVYAVNTGVLTSAMSFTTLIIYDLLPRNFIFIGCYFILSKLYAISFLATLNTRKNVKGRGTDREQMQSFQMVTDQRNRTPSFPLQVAVPAPSDGQSDVGHQEDGAHFSGQDSVKPVYAIGW